MPNCCLLCGRRDGRPVWRENGYVAVACRCGVTFTDPLPLPGEVDPTADLHPRDFYRRSAGARVRWLGGFVPSGALVEVGCGDGDFLAAAQAAGFTIGGIEAHPGRAALVAERLGVRVEAALLADAEWPTGSADVVYHCDLISHFDDPVESLRAMARLLRPGGVLFFEVGSVAAAQFRWYRLVDGARLPEHRWFLADRALESVLDLAGFEVVATRRFGLGPSLVLAGLRRLLTRDRSSDLRSDAGDDGRSGLRPWTHNVLRYGAGRWAPRLGPATVYVIARPRG